MERLPPLRPGRRSRCCGLRGRHILIACLAIASIILFTLCTLLFTSVRFSQSRDTHGANQAAGPMDTTSTTSTTVEDDVEITMLLSSAQHATAMGNDEGVGRLAEQGSHDKPQEDHEAVQAQLLAEARQQQAGQPEEVGEPERSPDATEIPTGSRKRGIRKRRGVIHTRGVLQTRGPSSAADDEEEDDDGSDDGLRFSRAQATPPFPWLPPLLPKPTKQPTRVTELPKLPTDVPGVDPLPTGKPELPTSLPIDLPTDIPDDPLPIPTDFPTDIPDDPLPVPTIIIPTGIIPTGIIPTGIIPSKILPPIPTKTDQPSSKFPPGLKLPEFLSLPGRILRLVKRTVARMSNNVGLPDELRDILRLIWHLLDRISDIKPTNPGLPIPTSTLTFPLPTVIPPIPTPPTLPPLLPPVPTLPLPSPGKPLGIPRPPGKDTPEVEVEVEPVDVVRKKTPLSLEQRESLLVLAAREFQDEVERERQARPDDPQVDLLTVPGCMVLFDLVLRRAEKWMGREGRKGLAEVEDWIVAVDEDEDWDWDYMNDGLIN